MAVKMDEFLLEYFRRLHFNAMPIEQFVKFGDYVRANDFSGNMKEWAETLLEKDPNTGEYTQVAKNYVRKSQPNPTEINGEWELKDDEWRKLFRAFQNTFRAMAANKNSFKYNDKAIKFLEQYFGDATKLFSNPTASPEATAQIQQLNQLLQNKRSQLQSMLGGYLADDFSYQDLLDGIQSKKYNSDPKFQKKLQDIASALSWNIESNPNVQSALGIQSVPDFSAITDPSKFESGGINADKLNAFQLQYSDLLKELYTNSKAYEAFSANDNSKISKKLEEAKSRMKYDDKQSDDYVPPKREDELTMSQRLSEWWDNTYSGYLDKYVKLKGDRVYFSPQAKQIVGAIDKAKIKPTDGLDKVLENAGKIKESLKYKSPTAAKQFGWFADTMSELKSTMPKAFAGALKNGRQLHVLVEEMIMKAVRDGKMAEAKTAMEILSVIKYGYTTSKIMDTLSKEKLSIFSDGGLSWNKNEGVKFVTTALDKSIKAAFMGIGYGITVAGNAFKLSGSKFNGDRGRLKNDQTAWQQQNSVNLNQTAHTYNILNQQNQNEIQQKQQEQQNLTVNHQHITADNYEQRKNDIETRRTAANAEQQRLEARFNNPQFTSSKNRVEKYETLSQELPSLRVQETTLRAEINRINQEIQSINVDPTMPDAEKNARITTLIQEQRPIEKELHSTETKFQDNLDEIRIITQNTAQWQADQAAVNQFIQDEQNHNNLVQQIDNDQNNLDQWKNASDQIQELQNQITSRNTQIAEWDDKHKDQYKELMAYWDFLETGRNTHMGKMYSWMPGSAKNKQSAFDNSKNAVMANYLSRYHYAA